MLINLTFDESEKKQYLSFLSITKKIAREGWIAPTPAAKKTSDGIASAIRKATLMEPIKEASKPGDAVSVEYLGDPNNRKGINKRR